LMNGIEKTPPRACNDLTQASVLADLKEGGDRKHVWNLRRPR